MELRYEPTAGAHLTVETFLVFGDDGAPTLAAVAEHVGIAARLERDEDLYRSPSRTRALLVATLDELPEPHAPAWRDATLDVAGRPTLFRVRDGDPGWVAVAAVAA